MSDAANHLGVSNISCERQERILFRNLNFDAHSGELVRILGKNGSGKSSLLKIIIGLLRPLSGEIQWNRQDIAVYRSDFVSQLTYIGHKAAIKTELTVTENIRTLLGFRGTQSSDESVANTLELLELAQYAQIQAGYLSQGQQRRIALSRLWLEPTSLWVLDEPYTALDKQGIQQIDIAISKALSAGTIVIMTSHQESEFFRDRAKTVSLAD